jgi:glycosyltransferase involved in cell wall biosynthesis
LGLEPCEPLIVYSGMTFSYRGIDRLIEAFALLRAETPSARLALVGGRPAEIAQLRGQAAGLGLDSAVLWAGQRARDAIPPFLHAADVLVIPDTVTDITASPLKLFEYLAAGRAVVLPNIPALAEVLPPQIGYYFQRGDTNALAAALRAALTDPSRPEREQAGLVAVARHTYATRATNILALAEAVARRHGTITT